jgi:3'-phosphoadenosine 5'-phosphosulfate sulfotransferase (PAPS reductase)/FAD synthetase|tara:strand:+ start:599 stop:1465 length:867 start_codon:yes stop_codon:yes gene_type:complete
MKLKKTSIFEFKPEHLEESLEDKEKRINNIISESLKNSRNPVLLFSGGSDSLLLLSFLLKHKPDIKVLYVDMKMNYPDFDKLFFDKVKPLIKNLIYKPINFSEEEFVSNFGIPIYPGIEEMGYDSSKFNDLNINNMCSKLKKDVTDKTLEEIKPDLTIMGFLASDKQKRYDRALKGYLQKGKEENLCIPIAMLKKEEVFKLLDKFEFPYVKEVYFNKNTNQLCKGDGVCWMCSAKCFSDPVLGNWNLIKTNYPNLWERLLKYGLKEKIQELFEKTKDKRFEKALKEYF